MPERPHFSAVADAALASIRMHKSVGAELVPIDRQRSSTVQASETSSPDAMPFGALIHFTNYPVMTNFLEPWKTSQGAPSTGTGFVISPIAARTILTNSHVVHAAASLRVEAHGRAGNYEGRVLCESEQCDLALVTVDDDSFWEDMPATHFAVDAPQLDDTVIAVGYPLGATSITVTRGVVSRVLMMDFTLMNFTRQRVLPAVQIDAAINPGNSGGPVFAQTSNKVVGVAFAGRSQAAGHGYIIPVMVVQMFLDAFYKTRSPSFGKLPSLGLSTQKLVNPNLRAMAFGGGVPKHKAGILVVDIDPLGNAKRDGIKVGDVVMKVDGAVVSEKGEVAFRGFELIEWLYKVTLKPIGSTVELVVLRRKSDAAEAEGAAAAAPVAEGTPSPSPGPTTASDGEKAAVGGEPTAAERARSAEVRRYLVKAEVEEVTVPVTLRAEPGWDPPFASLLGVDFTPGWCVFGGLVFLRLGEPLIRELLSDESRVGDALGLVYNLAPRKQEDAEYIWLADILPNALNVGYDRFSGQTLSMFNGTKVLNLAHLATLIDRNTDEYAIFQFSNSPPSSMLVFRMEDCRKTQDAILGQHKIPSWISPDIKLTPVEVA